MSEPEQPSPPSAGSDVPWPRQLAGDPARGGAGDPAAATAAGTDVAASAGRTATAVADPDDERELGWVAGGAGTVPRYSNARLVMLLAAVAIGIALFGPYIFLVIGALFVSVLLHEFGHYWAARRTGMKATEFFIGFGPRIWSFWRGETEYGIKAIPAGAYVRIIGMNSVEEVDPADEVRTYRAQTTGKRLAVVLAGPGMNLLLAFVILFSISTLWGRPDLSTWTVSRVGEGTAAAAAGIQPGDRILSVNGDPVGSFEDFKDVLDDRAGQQVAIAVERAGREETLTTVLRWRLTGDAAAAIPSQPPITRQDVIVSVDGTPVPDYAAFRSALTSSPGEATVRIERQGHLYEVRVPTPLDALPERGGSGYLGVSPTADLVRVGPIEAFGDTLGVFRDVTLGTFSGFGKLFTPTGLRNYAEMFVEDPDAPTPPPASTSRGVLTPVEGSPSLDSLDPLSDANVRPVSVVGIVRVGSETAESGMYELLNLIALVNIALGLLNLIPLLPFDGGHAVVATYEGIKGRLLHRPYRIDLAKSRLLPLSYGVFFIFVLLGVSAIFLDITQGVSLGP